MQYRRQGINYVEGDRIVPSNALKRVVEDYAVRMGELAQFKPGNDVGEIAERLGGRVHFQSIDDWVGEDGSIFVHGEADFDIALPHYTSPLRDRFTIAHELGHYFLHSQQGEISLIAYRKGTGRLEWEANWFAASLLMPEATFREVASQSDDIYHIARVFAVSVDAARVRKESLGV